ncbi:MAG: hypothetical protein WC748_09965 [Legionellales bacterium]|jgi:hypothetical protein
MTVQVTSFINQYDSQFGDFYDAWIGLKVTDYSLYFKIDGGANVEVAGGIDNVYPVVITEKPDATIELRYYHFVAGTLTPVIYTSSDGGDTWV